MHTLKLDDIISIELFTLSLSPAESCSDTDSLLIPPQAAIVRQASILGEVGPELLSSTS